MKMPTLLDLHFRMVFLTLAATVVTASAQITTQPEDLIAPIGSGVAFSAGVAGGAHVSQWLRYPLSPLRPVPAGVMDSLLIFFPSQADAGRYVLKVTPATGPAVFSNPVNLTLVDANPTTPVDRKTGDTVSFTARAWSGAPVTYQWYNSSNTALTDVPGSISGSQTKTLTLKNLPSGSGSFYARVKNSAGNEAASSLFTVNVSAVPPVVPTGTYVAAILPGSANGNVGGRMNLTISSKSITAKVYLGNKKAITLKSGPPTVSGPTLFAYMTNVTVSPPLLVIVFINTTQNLLDGSILRGPGNASFIGWKKTPRPSNEQGRYNFVLQGSGSAPTSPEGWGFGSLKIAASGSYTAAGRTACDEAFTTSAFMGGSPSSAAGAFPNMMLYSIQPSGSVLSGFFYCDTTGAVTNPNPVGNPIPNFLSGGALTWTRPASTAALYGAGFQLNLSIDGGRFQPNNTTLTQLVQAATGPVNMLFAGGGAIASIWNPTRPITLTDISNAGGFRTAAAKPIYGPARASLKIANSTGAVVPASSKFTLTDFSFFTLTTITRQAKIMGITYPTPNQASGVGVSGYFVMKALPGIFVPTTAQPTLSGRMEVTD